MELDLTDILEDGLLESVSEDNAIYDLQSIVVHKGEYGSGHYYSYVRPDVRDGIWYRFDDEFVTQVDYDEVVADASGGKHRRRRRSRSNSMGSEGGRRRGLLRRILSLFGVFLRRPRVCGGCGFGYGGRTSSAYMLQYVRRSDVSKLYLEQH